MSIRTTGGSHHYSRASISSQTSASELYSPSTTSTPNTSIYNPHQALNSPDQIRVVVRLRPFEGPSCITQLSDEIIEIENLAQPFQFDKVFSPSCTQAEVFDSAVRPTLDGVLEGYNGCVIAYGQTGAGKSHTMMGPADATDENKGAIPRMIDYLYAHKPESDEVRVGYLEIYNEKVRDLLSKQQLPQQDLKVHDIVGGGGFYVKGLTETTVKSPQDIFAAMRLGDKNRSVAATNMNACSSRSHSIFIVHVVGKCKQAKLVLVDLAGSEKVAKSGARGTLLEEAANINRSLSALGMVVNALASPDQPQHVPFRDSKLTRILQDSLAGNSRTCLILHCSPARVHASETVGTLRFGTRAKDVKTMPQINLVRQEGVSEEMQLQMQADFQMQLQLQSQIHTDLQTQNALQVQIHQEIQNQLQIQMQTQLQTQLQTQHKFLCAAAARDGRRLEKQHAQIAALNMQLMEYEDRMKDDEVYLSSKLWQLEPRVNKLTHRT